MIFHLEFTILHRKISFERDIKAHSRRAGLLAQCTHRFTNRANQPVHDDVNVARVSAVTGTEQKIISFHEPNFDREMSWKSIVFNPGLKLVKHVGCLFSVRE